MENHTWARQQKAYIITKQQHNIQQQNNYRTLSDNKRIEQAIHQHNKAYDF